MTNLRRSIAKHIPGCDWLMPAKPTVRSPEPEAVTVNARPQRHGQYGLTFEAERFLTPEIRARSKHLRTSNSIKPEAFEAASARALSQMHRLPFGDQIEYLHAHKARFLELDNIAAELLKGVSSAKILDVGMSVNTVVLKELLPGADIHVADRPDVVLDPALPYTLHNFDLNDPELDRHVLPCKFDLILFSEVIEHLLANPVRVLTFFIDHLTPNGRIVLTTPNFFAAHNLNAMRARFNPQPVFKAEYTRETGNAHHVREYSMSELLEMTEAAGGNPTEFFYSSCWDQTPDEIPEQEWLNLCVIVSRRE